MNGTAVAQACGACQVLNINGVRCHETGCPEAWRDYTRECKECGTAFTPEDRDQRFCDDACFRVYHGFPEEEGDGEDA